MRIGRKRDPVAARLGLLVLMAIWWGVGPVAAQQLGVAQTAILTVSSERMFAESAFGRRVARDIESQSAILAAENRRIEIELTAEEKELTERRPDMEPEAFRELADAFDAKVQDIRRTQDAKGRALVQFQEDEQVRFLQAARPILVELMRESGAGAILERSSVFLSANAIDITEAAIDRLDRVLGEAPPQADN
jgi:Skp family chaperone for outer membrane proteins